MGGGLMQLVAYGAQDIYLTGNPQITFFKVVYRRHTNFAVEAIEQTFNGAAASGQKFSCTISRNGDLLSRVYIETLNTAATGGANISKEGFNLIDHAEIEIGGQCIDKHYGEWMTLWTELTHASDKYNMLTNMNSGNGPGERMYIPMQFWFCRNPGLALPLIALQYHEVKLNVKMASYTGNLSACVFCDYVFLDTDERRRFAQVSHEYLIEQVQFSNSLKGPVLTMSAPDTAGTGKDAGDVKGSGNAELRFNHPVKELVWVVDQESSIAANYNTTNNNTFEVDSALLQLNGHDRFSRRAGSYFTTVQRYEHHSGYTASSRPHVYSFALKPEEHQPSGTCNFSRIDNAVLNYDVSNPASKTGANGTSTTLSHTLRVYAVNYNVLRIMSGMGGLAYSN